ncbi:hypothetical protein MSG28_001305 [Choristoneura fumiferana]|uniref:Uncharacterized protein n=1 Tax=Choristoneura fumiferana TaxID=7141 RepID=A0ACC0K4H7_CHOFU|nr:hypothetical protein MSG28_001305 [Choristoneura fumiferana]
MSRCPQPDPGYAEACSAQTLCARRGFLRALLPELAAVPDARWLAALEPLGDAERLRAARAHPQQSQVPFGVSTAAEANHKAVVLTSTLLRLDVVRSIQMRQFASERDLMSVGSSTFYCQLLIADSRSAMEAKGYHPLYFPKKVVMKVHWLILRRRLLKSIATSDLESCDNNTLLMEALSEVLSRVTPLRRGKDARASRASRLAAEELLASGPAPAPSLAALDQALAKASEAVLRAPAPATLPVAHRNGSMPHSSRWADARTKTRTRHWRWRCGPVARCYWRASGRRAAGGGGGAPGEGGARAALADLGLALRAHLPARMRAHYYWRAGQCYQECGEGTRAKVSMELALRLLKDDAERAQLRKQLDQLDVPPAPLAPPAPPASPTEITLTGGAAPNTPSLSNLLEIVEEEGKGRFAAARAGVRPGDVLLREEPYAACLLPERRGRYTTPHYTTGVRVADVVCVRQAVAVLCGGAAVVRGLRGRRGTHCLHCFTRSPHYTTLHHTTGVRVADVVCVRQAVAVLCGGAAVVRGLRGRRGTHCLHCFTRSPHYTTLHYSTGVRVADVVCVRQAVAVLCGGAAVVRGLRGRRGTHCLHCFTRSPHYTTLHHSTGVRVADVVCVRQAVAVLCGGAAVVRGLRGRRGTHCLHCFTRSPHYTTLHHTTGVRVADVVCVRQAVAVLCGGAAVVRGLRGRRGTHCLHCFTRSPHYTTLHHTTGVRVADVVCVRQAVAVLCGGAAVVRGLRGRRGTHCLHCFTRSPHYTTLHHTTGVRVADVVCVRQAVAVLCGGAAVVRGLRGRRGTHCLHCFTRSPHYTTLHHTTGVRVADVVCVRQAVAVLCGGAAVVRGLRGRRGTHCLHCFTRSPHYTTLHHTTGVRVADVVCVRQAVAVLCGGAAVVRGLRGRRGTHCLHCFTRSPHYTTLHHTTGVRVADVVCVRQAVAVLCGGAAVVRGLRGRRGTHCLHCFTRSPHYTTLHHTTGVRVADVVCVRQAVAVLCGGAAVVRGLRGRRGTHCLHCFTRSPHYTTLHHTTGVRVADVVCVRQAVAVLCGGAAVVRGLRGRRGTHCLHCFTRSPHYTTLHHTTGVRVADVVCVRQAVAVLCGGAAVVRGLRGRRGTHCLHCFTRSPHYTTLHHTTGVRVADVVCVRQAVAVLCGGAAVVRGLRGRRGTHCLHCFTRSPHYTTLHHTTGVRVADVVCVRQAVAVLCGGAAVVRGLRGRRGTHCLHCFTRSLHYTTPHHTTGVRVADVVCVRQAVAVLCGGAAVVRGLRGRRGTHCLHCFTRSPHYTTLHHTTGVRVADVVCVRQAVAVLCGGAAVVRGLRGRRGTHCLHCFTRSPHYTTLHHTTGVRVADVVCVRQAVAVLCGGAAVVRGLRGRRGTHCLHCFTRSPHYTTLHHTTGVRVADVVCVRQAVAVLCGGAAVVRGLRGRRGTHCLHCFTRSPHYTTLHYSTGVRVADVVCVRQAVAVLCGGAAVVRGLRGRRGTHCLHCFTRSPHYTTLHHTTGVRVADVVCVRQAVAVLCGGAAVVRGLRGRRGTHCLHCFTRSPHYTTLHHTTGVRVADVVCVRQAVAVLCGGAAVVRGLRGRRGTHCLHCFTRSPHYTTLHHTTGVRVADVVCVRQAVAVLCGGAAVVRGLRGRRGTHCLHCFTRSPHYTTLHHTTGVRVADVVCVRQAVAVLCGGAAVVRGLRGRRGTHCLHCFTRSPHYTTLHHTTGVRVADVVCVRQAVAVLCGGAAVVRGLRGRRGTHCLHCFTRSPHYTTLHHTTGVRVADVVCVRQAVAVLCGGAAVVRGLRGRRGTHCLHCFTRSPHYTTLHHTTGVRVADVVCVRQAVAVLCGGAAVVRGLRGRRGTHCLHCFTRSPHYTTLHHTTGVRVADVVCVRQAVAVLCGGAAVVRGLRGRRGTHCLHCFTSTGVRVADVVCVRQAVAVLCGGAAVVRGLRGRRGTHCLHCFTRSPHYTTLHHTTGVRVADVVCVRQAVAVLCGGAAVVRGLRGRRGTHCLHCFTRSPHYTTLHYSTGVRVADVVCVRQAVAVLCGGAAVVRGLRGRRGTHCLHCFTRSLYYTTLHYTTGVRVADVVCVRQAVAVLCGGAAVVRGLRGRRGTHCLHCFTRSLYYTTLHYTTPLAVAVLCGGAAVVRGLRGRRGTHCLHCFTRSPHYTTLHHSTGVRVADVVCVRQAVAVLCGGAAVVRGLRGRRGTHCLHCFTRSPHYTTLHHTTGVRVADVVCVRQAVAVLCGGAAVVRGLRGRRGTHCLHCFTRSPHYTTLHHTTGVRVADVVCVRQAVAVLCGGAAVVRGLRGRRGTHCLHCFTRSPHYTTLHHTTGVRVADVVCVRQAVAVLCGGAAVVRGLRGRRGTHCLHCFTRSPHYTTLHHTTGVRVADVVCVRQAVAVLCGGAAVVRGLRGRRGTHCLHCFTRSPHYTTLHHTTGVRVADVVCVRQAVAVLCGGAAVVRGLRGRRGTHCLHCFTRSPHYTTLHHTTGVRVADVVCVRQAVAVLCGGAAVVRGLRGRRGTHCLHCFTRSPHYTTLHHTTGVRVADVVCVRQAVAVLCGGAAVVRGLRGRRGTHCLHCFTRSPHYTTLHHTTGVRVADVVCVRQAVAVLCGGAAVVRGLRGRRGTHCLHCFTRSPHYTTLHHTTGVRVADVVCVRQAVAVLCGGAAVVRGLRGRRGTHCLHCFTRSPHYTTLHHSTGVRVADVVCVRQAVAVLCGGAAVVRGLRGRRGTHCLHCFTRSPHYTTLHHTTGVRVADVVCVRQAVAVLCGGAAVVRGLRGRRGTHCLHCFTRSPHYTTLHHTTGVRVADVVCVRQAVAVLCGGAAVVRGLRGRRGTHCLHCFTSTGVRVADVVCVRQAVAVLCGGAAVVRGLRGRRGTHCLHCFTRSPHYTTLHHTTGVRVADVVCVRQAVAVLCGGAAVVRGLRGRRGTHCLHCFTSTGVRVADVVCVRQAVAVLCGGAAVVRGLRGRRGTHCLHCFTRSPHYTTLHHTTGVRVADVVCVRQAVAVLCGGAAVVRGLRGRRGTHCLHCFTRSPHYTTLHYTTGVRVADVVCVRQAVAVLCGGAAVVRGLRGRRGTHCLHCFTRLSRCSAEAPLWCAGCAGAAAHTACTASPGRTHYTTPHYSTGVRVADVVCVRQAVAVLCGGAAVVRGLRGRRGTHCLHCFTRSLHYTTLHHTTGVRVADVVCVRQAVAVLCGGAAVVRGLRGRRGTHCLHCFTRSLYYTTLHYTTLLAVAVLCGGAAVVRGLRGRRGTHCLHCFTRSPHYTTLHYTTVLAVAVLCGGAAVVRGLRGRRGTHCLHCFTRSLHYTTLHHTTGVRVADVVCVRQAVAVLCGGAAVVRGLRGRRGTHCLHCFTRSPHYTTLHYTTPHYSTGVRVADVVCVRQAVAVLCGGAAVVRGLRGRRGTHCLHCFTRLSRCSAEAPLWCAGCAGAAFCSARCRRRAAYHRHECAFQELFIGSGMSILSHIALRMVTQLGLRAALAVHARYVAAPRPPPRPLPPPPPHPPRHRTPTSTAAAAPRSSRGRSASTGTRKGSKRSGVDKEEDKQDKDKGQKKDEDEDEDDNLEQRTAQVYQLCTHSEQRTGRDYLQRLLVAAFLADCLHKGGLFEGCAPQHLEDSRWAITELIIRNLQLLQRCARGAGGEGGAGGHLFRGARALHVAVAIYPTGALFNHDCFPATARLTFRSKPSIYSFHETRSFVYKAAFPPEMCNRNASFTSPRSAHLFPPEMCCARMGMSRTTLLMRRFRFFVGRSLVLAATRPLAAGSAAGECYGPAAALRGPAARRRSLAARYWFTCGCDACARPQLWPTLADCGDQTPPLRSLADPELLVREGKLLGRAGGVERAGGLRGTGDAGDAGDGGGARCDACGAEVAAGEVARRRDIIDDCHALFQCSRCANECAREWTVTGGATGGRVSETAYSATNVAVVPALAEPSKYLL